MTALIVLIIFTGLLIYLGNFILKKFKDVRWKNKKGCDINPSLKHKFT